MKEQPINPPDEPEDLRPQFASLNESEQEDIIETFHDEHHDDYIRYFDEALSQLPAGYDHFDLWLYIANCIVHNFPNQEWVI